MFDFVAIDLENADNDQFACQIGIVAVKNGDIVKELSCLIKPPGNRYGKYQTGVHGIDASVTADAPEFDVVWEIVKPYIQNQKLLMHNASTDKSILHKSLNYYFLPLPDYTVIDTCVEIGNHKLSVLAEAYDVDIIKHHDALNDARAVALIWLKHLEGYMPKELIREKSESKTHNFSNKKIDSSLFVQDISLCDDVTNPVYNGWVLYDVADFQQKAQYEAPKLN